MPGAGGEFVGLLVGSGFSVTANDDATTTTVVAVTSLTLSGSNNTVTLGAWWNTGNAIVFDGGSQNTIMGTGSAVISGGAVTVAGGAALTISGSANIITVSRGATISDTGWGNTIYAASAYEVTFGSGSHGNVVYVNGKVAASDDFVLGSTAGIPQQTEAQSAAGSLSGLQSAAASAAGIAQSPSEGATWDTQTVTVSFASAGGTFSDALNGQEQQIVEKALDYWSHVSGETFQIVPTGQSADITIGLGDLDTASTGLLGQTTCQADNASFQSGMTIQWEGPAQLAFIGGSDGKMIYSGTQASFSQVALHEIGHALGLANNSDPNSIMYYGSGEQNRQLDTTDIDNIIALYAKSDPPLPLSMQRLPGAARDTRAPVEVAQAQAPGLAVHYPVRCRRQRSIMVTFLLVALMKMRHASIPASDPPRHRQQPACRAEAGCPRTGSSVASRRSDASTRGRPAKSAAAPLKPGRLLSHSQRVLPGHHRFALSGPALLSAPTKRSYSSINFPILANGIFKSPVGANSVPPPPKPPSPSKPLCASTEYVFVMLAPDRQRMGRIQADNFPLIAVSESGLPSLS